LNRHIPPDEICYLTFIKEISNAFLSDYLEEFTEQVENQPRPRISTLHSFACRIIRNRGFTLGYDGSLFFTSFVSDDDPSSDIFIDDLLSFLRRFRDRSKPRIKGLICEAKAAWRNNIDPLRLHAPIPSLLSTTINLARTYRLIDWDQAIPFATNLYQNPDNRDRWLLRLHHFLIDEYQDFNAAEQALISLLIPDISSIVIVGDDNQSIYSGRGASPIGISQLITRPEVDSINLLRCRRQKSVLLHATNSFLHYMHPDAQPLLPHEEGGRINSFSFRSSKAEIEFLIQFLNTAIESLPSNPRPKDGIVCLFPLRKALRFYYERLSTHVPSTIRNPIPHNDRIFLSRLLELLIYRNQRFIERLDSTSKCNT
jgi:superfamily I DNA/RNA helicase